jgi:hypothetical protein
MEFNPPLRNDLFFVSRTPLKSNLFTLIISAKHLPLPALLSPLIFQNMPFNGNNFIHFTASFDLPLFTTSVHFGEVSESFTYTSGGGVILTSCSSMMTGCSTTLSTSRFKSGGSKISGLFSINSYNSFFPQQSGYQ